MADTGRPPLFKNPEDLQNAIDAYFSTCEPGINHMGERTEPLDSVTITGLALYIGFESRQSLYDYEKNPEFSYIIKRAKLRVEVEYEKRLQSKNPTGSIFALKNMGWIDKHEVNQTIEVVPFSGIEVVNANPEVSPSSE